MARQADFQLIVPGGAVAPDMLGLWATIPAATSFAAGAEQPTVLRWRVDLPANPSAAAAAVAEQEALLRQERQALNQQAVSRFEAAVAAAERPASFGIDIPRPERELAAWLQTMGGGESFWPGEDLLKGWRETVQQAQAFIEQVQRALTYFALVETSVEGKYLGRTRVHWLGDVTSEWRFGLDAQQAGLHRRNVGLAVESRTTWVRVFLLATRGAVLLSAVLGTPGGAILAMPAALKFIREVLAEFRQAQQQSETS